MKLNKKAQAPKAVIIAIVIFFIIVFTLIYSFFAVFRETQTFKASVQIEEYNENILLLNYLRTPVSIDLSFDDPNKPIILQPTTIADLIIFSIAEEKAIDKLKQESEKILTPYFQSPYFWKIIIFEQKQEQQEEIITFSQPYDYTWGYDQIAIFEQEIPSPDSKKYKIQLIKCED